MEEFHVIFSSHLAKGTRPPPEPTKRWSTKEFVRVTGIAETTVLNWRRGSNPPNESNMRVIEIALFGDGLAKDTPPYAEWRRELRAAFDAAKQSDVKELDEIPVADGALEREAEGNNASTQDGDALKAKSAHKIRRISNVPVRVPTHFQGRDEALEQIGTIFQSLTDRAAVVALFGMPGVGKTTLAAAYASKYRAQYDAIWWMQAERIENINNALQELGSLLGWEPIAEEAIRGPDHILEWLSDWGGSILMIFDNASNMNAIKPFLPRGDNAWVLITSNSHAWRGVAEPIEVPLWPKKIGARYLMARTGQNNETAAAEELSQRLEGLPLAHELAGAYCERVGTSISKYITQFDESPAVFLDDKRHAPAEYYEGRTVARTFDLAIAEATKASPAVEQLIILASQMGPYPISYSFLRLGASGSEEPLRSAITNGEIDELVAVLRGFGLITDLTSSDYGAAEEELLARERKAVPYRPSPESALRDVTTTTNESWNRMYGAKANLTLGRSKDLKEQCAIRVHRLVRSIVTARYRGVLSRQELHPIAGMLWAIVKEWQLGAMAEDHARCRGASNHHGKEDAMKEVLRVVHIISDRNNSDVFPETLRSQMPIDILMKMKWGGFFYMYD